MNRDNYNGQKAVLAQTAIVLTADANGDTVDTQGFDSVRFDAVVGISGDTLSGSVYIELELEEADDDGTGSPGPWTDVADADMPNAITGTNTGTFAVINDPAEDDVVASTAYFGAKRFVRMVVNLTGTHTNGTAIGATATKGHPHVSPVV